MKKNAYSVTALALLITGCAQQTFTVQNKLAAGSTKGNHHLHHFLFRIGQEETVDAAKICGGAEMLKQKPQQNIRKWIARFYYFRHLYPLEARYCLQYYSMS